MRPALRGHLSTTRAAERRTDWRGATTLYVVVFNSGYVVAPVVSDVHPHVWLLVYLSPFVAILHKRKTPLRAHLAPLHTYYTYGAPGLRCICRVPNLCNPSWPFSMLQRARKSTVCTNSIIGLYHVRSITTGTSRTDNTASHHHHGITAVASEIREIPRNSLKIQTYGVQGHPRSSILVPIESPYVTCC